MNNAAFIAAYSESRNGANHFLRHPLVKFFQYSDGVQQCAETGCYWLLDIVGTECCQALRKAGGGMGIFRARIAGNKGDLDLTTSDDTPPIWHRRMSLADLPDGEWLFYLVDEGGRFAFILPTEY